LVFAASALAFTFFTSAFAFSALPAAASPTFLAVLAPASTAFSAFSAAFSIVFLTSESLASLSDLSAASLTLSFVSLTAFLISSASPCFLIAFLT